MSYESLAKDKKVAVVAVLLVVLAAYFIYRSWQAGQPRATKVMTLPKGTYMSPKAAWIQQQRGQQGSNAPAQPLGSGGQ